MTTAHSVLIYCRPGFEGECAQEWSAIDAALGGGGYPRAAAGTGWIEYVALDAGSVSRLFARSGAAIFARQTLETIAHIDDLPARDRLGVLMPAIHADPRRWRDVWIESPDSDAGRELAALCRALNAALLARMKRDDLIDRRSPWRLHVCLTSADHAMLAAADVARASPWLRGIPRLKFPRDAPSRSTLKLEEALLVLLDDDERARVLQPGMRAVDLGAAPGGWTWQLVHRSIHVTAVDNGPMDIALMDSGLVEHRREDGFRYRPPKPVDWLVCDMVEKPRRVAALMGRWLADGSTRHAVFNLKLPMKKRHDEVVLCLDLLRREQSDPSSLTLRARQLYHDREEITVYARRDSRPPHRVI